MSYSIVDHIHIYSVWTAARAVQRNFTNTENIKSAIECTTLKTFIDSKKVFTSDSFDRDHIEIANKIIDRLKVKHVDTSYGRAAKIIAIYLKTAVIIRSSYCSLAKFAHPPIDSILLSKLNEKYPFLKLSDIRWTQLDENEYFKTINKLRKVEFSYFWEIEQHWSPIKNENAC